MNPIRAAAELYMFRLSRYLALKGHYRTCFGIAHLLGDLVYWGSHYRRKKGNEKLKLLLGENFPHNLRQRIRRQALRNFFSNMIEVSATELLLQNDPGLYVEFRGLEHLEAARSRGKGVLILSAHLGNWEFCGAALSLAGYPVNAVAWETPNHRLEEEFMQFRQRTGVKVIRPGARDVMKTLRALQRNELVVFITDLFNFFISCPIHAV